MEADKYCGRQICVVKGEFGARRRLGTYDANKGRYGSLSCGRISKHI